MNIAYKNTLYKNAGKTTAYWDVQAIEAEDGTAELIITHAKSLDGAATPKRRPVKGKNIGRSNETTPIQQAVAEAIARVDKQIDGGYVRTQEEAAAPVTNGLGKKKPQLSTDIRKIPQKVMDSIDWSTAYLQPKLNGNRGLHDEFLYSRAGNAFKTLDHLGDALEGTPLASLHLDGEIYKHDGTSLQVISGLIKKRQEGTDSLQYWLYDLAIPAPFSVRLATLTKAYDDSFNSSDLFNQSIILTPTVKVGSMEEALAEHAKNIAAKFEGSILRWGDDDYADGKRTVKSIKLKPFEDHEFKVVDYKWGAPNYGKDDQELLVPIYVYEISPGGIRGHVTAPGDMYEKHEQGKNVDDHMDRLMTITHMGYTLDGLPDIATAKCWYEPL